MASARPAARSQTALEALIGPIAAAAGCDVEQLTVSQAGRRSVIRVVVDADGGVSLDAVAQISRALGAALDAAEADGAPILASSYVLEVTSPGVDRPLTAERHWRRNVGRLVRVQTVDGPLLEGRIAAVADGLVTIAAIGGAWTGPVASLGPGKVQVEFARAGESDDVGDDLDGDDLDGEFDDDDEPDDDEPDEDLPEAADGRMADAASASDDDSDHRTSADQTLREG